MPTEFAEKMTRDCGYRYALDQDEGGVYLAEKQTDPSTGIPEAEAEWLTDHGVPDRWNMAFWNGFNDSVDWLNSRENDPWPGHSGYRRVW